METFSAWFPRSPLEKPRSKEPSHPTVSYEHSEVFTKDLVGYRDLGNLASPVNLDHKKRPLVWDKFPTKSMCKYFLQVSVQKTNQNV